MLPRQHQLKLGAIEPARLLDLVLIDHVVIGDGQWESIRAAYGKKAGFRS